MSGRDCEAVRARITFHDGSVETTDWYEYGNPHFAEELLGRVSERADYRIAWEFKCVERTPNCCHHVMPLEELLLIEKAAAKTA